MFLLSIPVFSAYTQSDLFGKIVFIALFLLSAISWVVLVHKVMLTRKLRVLSGKIDQFFESFPKIQATIPFKCPSCGYEEALEVQGLESFFV